MNKNKLEEKIIRKIASSSINFGIIEPNDKILVAVSGGKDSYALLYLLNILVKRLPFKVELVALHVAQGQPGVNFAPLKKWLENCGVPFLIAEEDTYSVVMRNIKEGDTSCSVCSRMRRGILYSRAEKLGCNKIALGHHREDTLSTLMMNLFYTGKMQAMPPIYTTDDKRFQVIRPMIEVAVQDLIQLSKEQQFPIVPCGVCSAQLDHKRLEMEQLLDRLEESNPQLKNVMLAAIKNIKPTHLLDKTIARIPQ